MVLTLNQQFLHGDCLSPFVLTFANMVLTITTSCPGGRSRTWESVTSEFVLSSQLFDDDVPEHGLTRPEDAKVGPADGPPLPRPKIG